MSDRVNEAEFHPTIGYIEWEDGSDPVPEMSHTERATAAVDVDVDDLALFFHEEYWSETGWPHLDREASESTDCEICWGSTDRLVARLSVNEGGVAPPVDVQLLRIAYDAGRLAAGFEEALAQVNAVVMEGGVAPVARTEAEDLR